MDFEPKKLEKQQNPDDDQTKLICEINLHKKLHSEREDSLVYSVLPDHIHFSSWKPN